MPTHLQTADIADMSLRHHRKSMSISTMTLRFLTVTYLIRTRRYVLVLGLEGWARAATRLINSSTR